MRQTRPAAPDDLTQPTPRAIALYGTAHSTLAGDPSHSRDFSRRSEREEKTTAAAISDSAPLDGREIIRAAHAMLWRKSFGTRLAHRDPSRGRRDSTGGPKVSGAGGCWCGSRSRESASAREPSATGGSDRLVRVGRHRQALAAASAASSEHLATALGLHAGAEAVRLLLVTVVRAERALHVWEPLGNECGWRKERGQ